MASRVRELMDRKRAGMLESARADAEHFLDPEYGQCDCTGEDHMWQRKHVAAAYLDLLDERDSLRADLARVTAERDRLDDLVTDFMAARTGGGGGG